MEGRFGRHESQPVSHYPTDYPSQLAHLIDIAQNNFNCIVLQHFSHYLTVSTSNYEYLLRIRVTREGEVSNHFLIAVLV